MSDIPDIVYAICIQIILDIITLKIYYNLVIRKSKNLLL